MSQEQAQLAEIQAAVVAQRLTGAVDDYRQLIASQFDRPAQAKVQAHEIAETETFVNINFIADAVGLLPRVEGTVKKDDADSRHFYGDYYNIHPAFQVDAPTALLLSRLVIWDSINPGNAKAPSYVIGEDGRRNLFMKPFIAIDADSWPETSDATVYGTYGYAWQDMQGKPNIIEQSSRETLFSKKSVTPPLTEQLAPASRREQKYIEKAFNLETGKYEITNGRLYSGYISTLKVDDHGHRISSADMARYNVVDKLAELTAIFGKAAEYAELCSRWRSELPGYKPGTEPDPTVLGILAGQLGIAKVVDLQKQQLPSSELDLD